MEANDLYADRLHRFMSIFGINRFEISLSDPKIIRATVGWPDDGSEDYDETDEVQNILWHVQDDEAIEDALILGKFIFDNKLISIDKIIVNSNFLQNKINWKKERFNLALKMLLSIKVSMLDYGEETDSFFIHF